MHSIETHQTAPQNAFLWKDDIYIKYVYDDTPFYFTAPVVPAEEKAGPYSLLKPKRASESDRYAQAPRVVLVGKEWGEVVKEVILSLVPQRSGQGRILFIGTYETVLYKRADGTTDLAELADAPANVQIIGRVEAQEFDRLLFENLKTQIEASGAPYTRFLLRLDGVPLTPFMYVDIENGLMTPLQLPPYYELEKEMSSLGFSTSFIWSFFVKSHVFGIIKAPFTSSFRLLSFLPFPER